MALVRRWWGWAVFVALLVGVGAVLHALVPPQPRLRLDGAVGVAVSDDGGTLLTLNFAPGDKNLVGPLRTWDTRSGRLLRTLGPGLKMGFRDVFAFSPDLAWLVCSPEVGKAKLVSLRDGGETVLDLEAVAKQLGDRAVQVKQFQPLFFGQSRHVALHIDRGMVALVELAGGKVLHQAAATQVLGFAGPGPTCLYVGDSLEVSAFDLASGKVKGVPFPDQFVGISADLSKFATQRTEEVPMDVQIWDAATFEKTHTLAKMPPLLHACFSPDKRMLAAVSVGIGKTTVWEIASGKRLFELRCSSASFGSVAFSPDGRWLAGRDLDGTKAIRFFDLRTGEQRGELDSARFNVEAPFRFLDDCRLVMSQPIGHQVPMLQQCVEELSLVELQPDQQGDAFLRPRFSTNREEKEGDEVVILAPNARFAARIVRDERNKLGWLDRAREKLKD